MALNPKISKIARQKIGGYLRDIRKLKFSSIKKMSETTGLAINTIHGIESGGINYTIDAFLAYINAVDCYFYLADRKGKHLDEYDLLKNIDNPI